MATPVGHSIVGYTLARAAGVRSRTALAAAIGAASLPDVDFILGYMTNGDARSLHHEVITHKPAFSLLVGAATGAAAVAASLLLRRRLPAPGEVLRPAALAAALVGSHVAMDKLPLPYDTAQRWWGSAGQVVAAQGWNAVIDLAVYGTVAMVALGRNDAAEAPA